MIILSFQLRERGRRAPQDIPILPPASIIAARNDHERDELSSHGYDAPVERPFIVPPQWTDTEDL